MSAESPLPDSFPRLIAPDKALRLVTRSVTPLSSRRMPLKQANGLHLAEDIFADRDYPAFDRAMMDGFAVRQADAGGWSRVIGEVAAGGVAELSLTDGHCYRIMTGAPCPVGTEAVVPKEEICADGDRVLLPAKIQPRQHIAKMGCECRRGHRVLLSGQRLTSLAIATLASFGVTQVLVTPRPSLAVITTGAELIPADVQPGPGQIRDSNGPMVVALACEMGLDAPLHLHAEDTLAALSDALEQVGDRDMVLLTGGVSMGRYDYVPEALQRYGAVPVFHKVRQKPGKPLLFARSERQYFFGLPGNPLAAHLCFNRYVSAAIRRMQNKRGPSLELRGRLAATVGRKPDRTYFIAARAEIDTEHPFGWSVKPMPGQTSADVFVCAAANCYVEVPPGESSLKAGEEVGFTWMAGLCDMEFDG